MQKVRKEFNFQKLLHARRGNNGVSQYPRYQKIFWITENMTEITAILWLEWFCEINNGILFCK